MRKILIGVAIVLVLLVGAVLVVPGLIDWNGYKPRIQEAAKEATGRDLIIDGDLSLSILPSPSLSVEKVSFANMAGASEAPMASLDALRVNVALGPLLSGDIRITSVDLVRPTVMLERLPDGRANWELAVSQPDDAGAADGDGSSAGSAGGPAVALDTARIEDGTIVYRDLAAGTEHRIESLNATVAAGGLEGPFDVDGTLTYGGLPLRATASVGRIDSGRATSVKLELGVADDALKATTAGALDLDAGPSFKGDVRIEAPDLGAALAATAGAAGTRLPALPSGLKQSLSLTTKVDGSPQALALADLILNLGESRLQGGVSVALGETIALEANLSGNRLDLDALLPAGSSGVAPAEQAADAPTAPGGGPDIAFTLPTDLSASIEVAIDALQYRGASIRKARLAADLVDGAGNLRLATAQLPGGTEVTATGTVLADDSVPHFVGRIEVVSDNLRGTLDWAGVDTSAVAPDRLRKASVKAAIDATPQQIQVTDWTMELDATRARGGLTLAVRDRPAFGLSLDVDRINVDAYLPVGDAGGGAGSGAAAPADGDGPQANPLAILDTVDANVRLTVGEATVMGAPVREARVDALLQDGTLTLRDVGVTDVGGARATVSGVLRDAATKPTVDMSFDVTVTSVDRFAALLSAESPIPAKQLGQVSLKGSAQGDMEDVRLDLRLAAAGGSFEATGTARPLATPPGLDLKLAVAHPDARKLAQVVAPGALDGVGGLGALNGTASVRSRDDGRYASRVDLQIAGGAIGLVGNVDPFAATPDVDMAVEVNHPDAARLIRSLAPDYRPAGANLGPLMVRTRFQGPVDDLRLFETEVNAGAIKATGNGRLEATGPRPKVSLALEAGRVDLDPWLPADAPKPQGAAPPAPAAPGGREWSRERLDLSALSVIDADLRSTVQAIKYGAYVVDNAQFVATVLDGVLTVSKLAGGMFGGTFDMTASATDASVPTAALTVRIRDADIRQAAATAANTDTVRGILTYDTDLRTEGVSEFAMVSNLGGTGSFNVREGVVEGFDLRSFSEKLKELDRAPDFVQLAQRALSGGSTQFSKLAGTYTVTKGVLRSNDIVLNADAADGKATAVVDLPPQQMDVNTSFRLSDHPNAPPVGVRLVGPLDNPRQILDIDAMQAYVIQRLVERGVLRQLDKDGRLKSLIEGGQSGGTATEDAAPAAGGATSGEPVKPEDAVRGLLKGILKN